MMQAAEFVEHLRCPACGSSDANTMYSDGHTHCFSCGAHTHGDGDSITRSARVDAEFLQGSCRAITKRGLTEQTCQKYAYKIGTNRHGETVHIEDYRDATGTLVAQHTRNADKEFAWIGNAKGVELFGQHLWKSGGKRVVVTEGALDALTVAQVFNLSWPVVSLPSGAQGGKRAIQDNLEWLSSYEEVVLWFDADEAGRKAVAECAPLFKPGKCKVVDISTAKDASDLLQAGRVKEVATAVYEARSYRPDGIVNAADLWTKVTEKLEPGVPYPWEKLSKITYGQRKGTLTCWTAGSGTGKSSILAQVAYELAYKHGLKVGYVALEESVGRSAQRFLGLHLRKLVHLPGVATEEELRMAFDETLAKGNVWFFEHFGSSEADNLIAKLRYLAVGCEVDVLVLDHLSIAVSGLGLANDERRLVDHLMTALRSLVEETDVICHVISHLRRAPAEEASAEEGGRVSLAMLRGSHSIAQLSDMVIGVESDLQSEDRTMLVRVLKNRVSGETGIACHLAYDRSTGWISEAVKKKEPESEF